MNEKRNIIKDKSFAFAIDIVKIYQQLIEKQKEYVLSKQLLRSGTAVGALVREAQNAESKILLDNNCCILLSIVVAVLIRCQVLITDATHDQCLKIPTALSQIRTLA